MSKKSKATAIVLAVAALAVSQYQPAAADVTKRSSEASGAPKDRPVPGFKSVLMRRQSIDRVEEQQKKQATRDSFSPEEQQYWDSANKKADAGDYKGAIEDYSKMISIKPTADAYANRAWCYLQLNENLDCLSDADQAVTLSPTWSWPHALKGDAYYYMNEYEAGIDAYTAAIGLTKTYKYCYDMRGNCYFGLRKYDLALADYNKAILIDPKYFWAYYDRIWTHVAMKSFELAKKDAEKMIVLKPESGHGHYALGYTLESAGDKAGAVAAYKKGAEVFKAAGDNYNLKLCQDKVTKLGGTA